MKHRYAVMVTYIPTGDSICDCYCTSRKVAEARAEAWKKFQNYKAVVIDRKNKK